MMRTLLFKVALCTAIILAPTTMGAKDNSFKKLSKIEGVEHIHIPKMLINLAAKKGESLNIGENISLGDKSGDLLKKIDTVDIFTSEEKDSAKKLSSRAKNILNGKGWEALVDASEDGQKVKICQVKQGKNTTFVVFAEEKDETTLVVIKGEIDLAKLLEQQMATEGESLKEQ